MIENQLQEIDDHWWMRSKLLLVATTIVGVSAVAVATYIVLYVTTTDRPVSSYAECVKTGGIIAESYPEQCFIDGESFVNDEQEPDADDDNYIGLSEQEALDKATKANVPSRVVERDGKPQATTMDIVQGRLNFSIKNGKVYSVFVESF